MMNDGNMLTLVRDAMQACVIYRDIDDGDKLTEVSDFVGKQGLGAMTSFLSGVCATGGADECESIASGLKVSGLPLRPQFLHEQMHPCTQMTLSRYFVQWDSACYMCRCSAINFNLR